jgi:hypothetical protein
MKAFSFKDNKLTWTAAAAILLFACALYPLGITAIAKTSVKAANTVAPIVTPGN